VRQDIIAKLDSEERNWLYKAIGRMVMADKKVESTEQRILFWALAGLAGSSDMTAIKKAMSSAYFMSPFKPLVGLPAVRAWDIFSEVVLTASTDSEFSPEEKKLLRQIIECLGFVNGKHELMAWAEQMAAAFGKEIELKSRLDELTGHQVNAHAPVHIEGDALKSDAEPVVNPEAPIA